MARTDPPGATEATADHTTRCIPASIPTLLLGLDDGCRLTEKEGQISIVFFARETRLSAQKTIRLEIVKNRPV